MNSNTVALHLREHRHAVVGGAIVAALLIMVPVVVFENVAIGTSPGDRVGLEIFQYVATGTVAALAVIVWRSTRQQAVALGMLLTVGVVLLLPALDLLMSAAAAILLNPTGQPG